MYNDRDEGGGKPPRPQDRAVSESEKKPAAEIPPPPRKRGFLLAALVAAGLIAWGAHGHSERAARAEETQRRQNTFVHPETPHR